MNPVRYGSIFIGFFAGILLADPWISDLGNGTYRNPILFADYSDPDVIRVGDDFYMVASSFNCSPGIPVLHSRDLVNWILIGHVFEKLPFEKYDKPAHGEGAWAPSIRYHNGFFYVYVCTPHEGLFMAEAVDPRGPWKLRHVADVELWEDPCPFWDDDGRAYLVRSKLCAGALYLHHMSEDGRSLLDNGTLIYEDPQNQPTIEGPKLMKKDGVYIILAPAGGVPQGWQTALRSKNIEGPYEARIVLHQGDTQINGPHQGGLTNTQTGDWWFVHFQDRDAYGRVVHLQPVEWKDGWPLMGLDRNSDGIGEPVLIFRKPDTGYQVPVQIPQTSDEFESDRPGLQWQWHANNQDRWYSMAEKPGSIRLYAVRNLTQDGNLWYVPNLLLQKFSAPQFTMEASVVFHPDLAEEKCGLVIMGTEWACVAIEKESSGVHVGMFRGDNARCTNRTVLVESCPAVESVYILRVDVNEGSCSFSFSQDGEIFHPIGELFTAQKGLWIGAKAGVFCLNPNIKESRGYADVDWVRVK